MVKTDPASAINPSSSITAGNGKPGPVYPPQNDTRGTYDVEVDRQRDAYAEIPVGPPSTGESHRQSKADIAIQEKFSHEYIPWTEAQSEEKAGPTLKSVKERLDQGNSIKYTNSPTSVNKDNTAFDTGASEPRSEADKALAVVKPFKGSIADDLRGVTKSNAAHDIVPLLEEASKIVVEGLAKYSVTDPGIVDSGNFQNEKKDVQEQVTAIEGAKKKLSQATTPEETDANQLVIKTKTTTVYKDSESLAKGINAALESVDKQITSDTANKNAVGSVTATINDDLAKRRVQLKSLGKSLEGDISKAKETIANVDRSIEMVERTDKDALNAKAIHDARYGWRSDSLENMAFAGQMPPPSPINGVVNDTSCPNDYFNMRIANRVLLAAHTSVENDESIRRIVVRETLEHLRAIKSRISSELSALETRLNHIKLGLTTVRDLGKCVAKFITALVEAYEKRLEANQQYKRGVLELLYGSTTQWIKVYQEETLQKRSLGVINAETNLELAKSEVAAAFATDQGDAVEEAAKTKRNGFAAELEKAQKRHKEASDELDRIMTVGRYEMCISELAKFGVNVDNVTNTALPDPTPPPFMRHKLQKLKMMLGF
eukprot:m.40799 g.40799  ORF g.40799 m.40799 type:complete len:602 (-) comp8135_c0_seq1:80-1885(-)